MIAMFGGQPLLFDLLQGPDFVDNLSP
jgi:hypothetical protein